MATISVFVPAFNVAGFLSYTIQSVLSQTYQDWEMLIIDDCSSDDTYAIARHWAMQDPRINVVRNDTNLGMLENWNKGISLCTCPFFVKLDADDIWHPQMLEKAMEVLEHNPGVGLVFSRYINIDAKGNEIPGSDVSLPDFARGKAFSTIPLVAQGPDKMLGYTILRQGLSVMRREVFDKVGVYKYLLTRETQAATDTEFYFRVGAHFMIFCIDEVLYRYRVHQNSISAVDHKNFLSDKKLFEIKYSIISYFAERGLLDKRLAARFLRRVERTYTFSRIAHLRTEVKTLAFVCALLKQVLKAPIISLTFYFHRFLEKTKYERASEY
jgi:glycosyltransferase involved in cell wall biosynthesis